VVIGGVTPVTALSYGVASAPSSSLGVVAFALIWFCTGSLPISGGKRRDGESSAVSSGEISVTFVIPAVVLAGAYAAVHLNEWAIRRDLEREHRTPGA